MADRSNATMATNSFDRTTGSALATVTAPYNSFLVRAQGGPIIQGQINKIRVSEVRFPYDIPTVVEGKNDKMAVYLYDVLINPEGDPVLINTGTFTLTVPQGWYTGTEMEASVNAAFADGSAAFVWWPADVVFNCAYQESSQTLTFVNADTYSTTIGQHNYFFGLEPLGLQDPNLYSNPSLLWTLGFRSLYSNIPVAFPNLAQLLWAPAGYNIPNGPQYPVVVPPFAQTCTYATGCPYTGAYTDFVDICSPALCQAQYIRDGSTSQSALRRDLITRLYVANETSTREPIGAAEFVSAGCRPFIIHRQFKNTKNMKWTADRSIDAINLSLYDMYGQPLPIPTVRYYGASAPPFPPTNTYISLGGGARDYQITFLVDEHEDLHEVRNNVGYSYSG